MRTTTSLEDQGLAAAHARSHVRLEVEDAAGYGTFNDLTPALIGFDIHTSVDQSVISGTVTLGRSSIGASSLSPLVTDALDAGRRLRIYISTLPLTSSPDPGDLRLLLDAQIDSVDAGDDAIELAVRDWIGATIADRDLVEPLSVPVTPGGFTLDQILESILIHAAQKNEVIPEFYALHDIPTDFDTPAGVTIGDGDAPLPGQDPAIAFVVDAKPVLEALKEGASRVGWQLRPRWHEGDGEFKLAFYEPPRDSTTPDITIPADRYIVIPQLKLDRTDIRNFVRVSYLDAATGERATYQDKDDASVQRFGSRFMSITEGDDSPISSEALAQRMVDAALSDLADPMVDAEVEVMMMWPVDLDDIVELEANDEQFTSNQTLAVVGYRHTYGPDIERTRLMLRGRPTGGVEKWRGWLPRESDFLEGLFWGEPLDDEDFRVDLFAQAFGVHLPVIGQFYRNDPQSEPVFTHLFTVSGETVGPTEFPELGGVRVLTMQPPQWWLRLSDRAGNVRWIQAGVKLDRSPSLGLQIIVRRVEQADGILFTVEFGPLVDDVWAYHHTIMQGAAMNPRPRPEHLRAVITRDDLDEDGVAEYFVPYPDVGLTTFGQFEPHARADDPLEDDHIGSVVIWEVRGPEAPPPVVEVREFSQPQESDLTFIIRDTPNTSGILYVWTNPHDVASADPDGPVDAALPFTVAGNGRAELGPGDSSALDDVKKPLNNNTKRIYYQVIMDDGRDTGVESYALANFFDRMVDELGEQRANSIASFAAFAETFRPWVGVDTMAERDALEDLAVGTRVLVRNTDIPITDPTAPEQVEEVYVWTGTNFIPDTETPVTLYAAGLGAGAVRAEHISGQMGDFVFLNVEGMIIAESAMIQTLIADEIEATVAYIDDLWVSLEEGITFFDDVGGVRTEIGSVGGNIASVGLSYWAGSGFEAGQQLIDSTLTPYTAASERFFADLYIGDDPIMDVVADMIDAAIAQHVIDEH